MRNITHKISYLILTLAALAVASCGNSSKFTISGEVNGSPNMNLYIRYFGSSGVSSGVARVQNGEFEISGYSDSPTLVEISDNERTPLGYLYLKNGDEADVTLDRSNPMLMKASGTSAIADWSRLANSFAEDYSAKDPKRLNEKIAAQVASNPSSVSAAILFATAFDASIDPVLADSTLNMFSPEILTLGILDSFVGTGARYASAEFLAPIDSLAYRPLKRIATEWFRTKDQKVSLISMSNLDNTRRALRNDTILPALKKASANKKIKVIDLGLYTDTITWRNIVRSDSATWIQGWVPGGIFAKGIDRLAIPSLPYYIVTDSTGAQIYRGPSVEDAAEAALSEAETK